MLRSDWGKRRLKNSMARVLPFSSKLGFGVGQLAEGITLGVSNTFILFYFNKILGVSGTLTGIALGISLFCDAITDPLAGSISDRLKTRWGRRIPMMAVSALPLGLAIICLFNPPAGMSELFYFCWLIFFAVLVRVFLTLYHIPHLALGAEMAHDYVDRTKIFGYSQLFGSIGSTGFGFLMLTFFFPTPADGSHGLLNVGGYTPLSLTAALGIAISIGLCVWGTSKEIPYMPEPRFKTREKLRPRRLFNEIKTAFQNPSYRVLVGGLFFAVIMLGIESTFMVYMYVHFWEMPTEKMRWFGPASLLALPISVAMAPLLTKYLDKKKSLITLSAIIIINTNIMICLRLFTDLLPAGGSDELLMLLLFFGFIGGLCGPAVLITLNSMFADISDEQELITGERQEGIIFSARSFAFKAGGSVASILGGFALDIIEFPRGAEVGTVSADILFRLGIVCGPMTSIIGLIILTFYMRYRLDRKQILEIQKELELRREHA